MEDLEISVNIQDQVCIRTMLSDVSDCCSDG